MTEQPPAQSTENEARRLPTLDEWLEHMLDPNFHIGLADRGIIATMVKRRLSDTEARANRFESAYLDWKAVAEAAEASVRGLIEASVEREAKLREYEELRKAVAAYLGYPTLAGRRQRLDRALTRSNDEEAK